MLDRERNTDGGSGRSGSNSFLLKGTVAIAHTISKAERRSNNRYAPHPDNGQLRACRPAIHLDRATAIRSTPCALLANILCPFRFALSLVRKRSTHHFSKPLEQ
jgi:hypothetical protein